MDRKIYILVPALDHTGPIKGAMALANGLADSFNVTFVILKRGKPSENHFRPAVTVVSLEPVKGWRRKIQSYRALLQHDRLPDQRPMSLSVCFSADMVNLFQKKNAVIVSSMRANLFKNYFYSYGIPGFFLAIVHYFFLRFFDRILALSDHMARQLSRLGIKKVSQIGNFVDEFHLELYREKKQPRRDPITFLFMGSLTERKKPASLIHAMNDLRRQGIDCRLLYLGSGPLLDKLKKLARCYGLTEQVVFLGHRDNPYDVLQQSDYLVLPSVSEGIPRAALEALYFGIPCILRNVDGTGEMITQGINGYLFNTDLEMRDILKRLACQPVPDREKGSPCLLPPAFRYNEAIGKHVSLIENLR